MRNRTLILAGVGLFLFGVVAANLVPDVDFLQTVLTFVWLLGIGFFVTGVRGVRRARNARQSPHDA